MKCKRVLAGITVLAVWALSGALATAGAIVDCNGNGVDDPLDIAGGASEDCNLNAVPDECDVQTGFTEEAVATYPLPVVWSGPADLDGDGDLDLMMLNYTWTDPGDEFVVGWHENTDGAGALGPLRTIDTSVGMGYRAASADLDGDGDADVLYHTYGVECFDCVVWSRNIDGAGNFGPAIVIQVDTFSRFVGAADLDGDGDADVLQSGRWYENLDGLGSFGPPRTIAGVAWDTTSIVAADLDGDGDLDLLHAAWDILWNENLDGAGNFGPAITIATTGVGHSASGPAVSAGDLDGDLDLDFAIATGSGDTIKWFENLDGAGTFDAGTLLATTANTATAVQVTDLDGDGDLDIVGADWAGAIKWFENLDGLGTFGSENVVPASGGSIVSLAAADLTSSGSPDLVVARYFEATVYLFRNGSLDCDANAVPDGCDVASGAAADCNANGIPDVCDLGTNHSADCNANEHPDECDVAGGTSPDCGNGVPDECDTADCNANGIADDCDIASGTSLDCDGNWLPDECEPDCNDNGIADLCDVAAGFSVDCDGDGVPDECQPDCNGNGIVDRCDITGGTSTDCNPNGIPDECEEDCNGNGTADDCEMWNTTDCDGNGVLDECEIADGLGYDCDADGVMDTCQDDCNGNLLNDSCDIASGQSTDCDLNTVPDECDVEGFSPRSVSSANAETLTGADISGDGRVDVVYSVAGDLYWKENIGGTGNFLGVEHLIHNGQGRADALVAADLDGDSDADLIVALTDDTVTPASHTIEWFENFGTGGLFSHPRPISDATQGSKSLAVADMDGDGDPDLVAALWQDDKVVWFENLDGEGQFGPWQSISDAAGGARSVFAADLDTDGDADLVAALYDEDRITWFETLEDGQFLTRQSISLETDGAVSVSAADLDGDGDLDVVSGSTLDGKIAWYENEDGAGSFGVQRTIFVDTSGLVQVLTVDVDGDGDRDVVSTSRDTGGRILWYENDGVGGFSAPRAVSEDPADAIHAAFVNKDLDMDFLSLEVDASSDPVAYQLNMADDCNGNGVPDECEDCTGVGLADSCVIAFGLDLDCNANGVPDTCDTPCTVDCDEDGDLCLDDVDGNPSSPFSCADTDGDGCDDCSSGTFAPAADGVDTDADGFCDPGDCAPGNAFAWAEPGAIDSLRAAQDPGSTRLSWTDPRARGSVLLRYDTLRSTIGADFGEATCLENDETDREAADGEPLSAGVVFFYLIRVENDCPGPGNLGQDSEGMPRSGAGCP